MRCSTCNTDSPTGATICRACGTALTAGYEPGDGMILPVGSLLQSGTYTVGKPLGQGGFGITYLGSDVRLSRPVAIKELFPHGCVRLGMTVQPARDLTADGFGTYRTQFLEEARVLAQFHDLNIVQVYASFEENNTAYMVMELLRGKTLLSLVEERGTLPEGEAVGYILGIATALKAVHAAGLLHRDIKPDNVVVTDSGRVALVDFGTARAFATNKTRRMTTVLTPGYAPLEQYSQQARFAAYTDGYALGATLYHLLTGQPPVAATDRASGIALQPPAQLNPSVSQTVNDAVVWALEMQAADRPQSVGDFAAALRGSAPTTRSVALHGAQLKASVPGGPSVLLQLSPAPHDPFKARASEIASMLAQPLTAPSPFPEAARISALEAALARAARYTSPAPHFCPGCRQPSLRDVSVGSSTLCPLCRAGQLRDRHWDLHACPICHSGRLTERRVADGSFFCPVCRLGVVGPARRMLFGRTEHAICPSCATTYHLSPRFATMVKPWPEKVAAAAPFIGSRRTVSDWQRLSGRAQRFLQCSMCITQLDEVDSQRWVLVADRQSDGSPEHSSGTQRLVGHALYREAWAKLAAELPLTAGNRFCAQCKAEFEYDSGAGMQRLLSVPGPVPSWAQRWNGIAAPVEHWLLASVGKSTLRPGLVCDTCQTELDREAQQLTLARTSAPTLAALVGQSYTLEDWQRQGAGAITTAEREQLRTELLQLQRQKARMEEQINQSQPQARALLERELLTALRQSFTSGRLLCTAPAGIKPPSGERLLFAGVGQKLHARIGGPWRENLRGTLLLTNKSLILDGHPDRVWRKALTRLYSISTQDDGQLALLVAKFTDSVNPVAFAISNTTVKVSAGGLIRDLPIGPQELVELIQTLCRGMLLGYAMTHPSDPPVG